MRFLREGRRHRPGGAWRVLIRAGSVAAALYVLWIGALATVVGDLALDAARVRASSAPNGSSSSITWGAASTVRAKATRWRMPPESWEG